MPGDGARGARGDFKLAGDEPGRFSRGMDIQFPKRDYEGYIFDCDGTLIDSMPVHYRAWLETLQAHGLADRFSEDEFYALGGVPTVKLVRILGERHHLELDPERVAAEKEAAYLRLLSEVPVIEPVAAFARRLAAEGGKVAVASGGSRHVVERALQAAGLRELFPVVVTADDVEHGKPAPDMFLLAAEKLGVNPAGCLVLEDAVLGRQAAEAAGMDCLMIPCARERRAGARG